MTPFADIVARIRELCPDFAHVDHVMTSASSYSYPAALVVPVKRRADPPSINIPGAFRQDVALVFGVYVVMERRQNGVADNGGADQFDVLCTSLQAALVGWEPDGANTPVIYVGGEMAPYDAGIVTWREDFAIEYEVQVP